jgi:hypothetical protein
MSSGKLVDDKLFSSYTPLQPPNPNFTLESSLFLAKKYSSQDKPENVSKLDFDPVLISASNLMSLFISCMSQLLL